MDRNILGIEGVFLRLFFFSYPWEVEIVSRAASAPKS